MLSEMRNYISSYNFNSISFESLYLFLTQVLCVILMNLYIGYYSTDESDYEEFIEFLKNDTLDVYHLYLWRIF